MQQSDRAAFAQLMRDVMAFYNQDLGDFAFGVWWQACQRYDLGQVRRALTAHAMDAERGMFAPKPADLVRQLEGTAGDRAMIAWGKVLHAIGAVGAYSDVIFDDAAIHAAVDDLGGWVKICRGETKDLSYLQHRFCEAHRAYVGRGEFDYPRRLTGDRSPDDVYAKRGLQPPWPAIVGDKSAAQLVYSGGKTGGKTMISYQSLRAVECGPAAMLANTLRGRA